MNCCNYNEKKRQKMDQHLCYYCECTFRKKRDLDKHIRGVHTCSKCYDVGLTGDARAMHTIRHKQEADTKELQKQRQRQMDKDFILDYVKANKLDEWQWQSDYEPDFDYILTNHRFENEELLRFVKKFPDEFADFLGCSCESFASNDLIYLVENGAWSIDDLAESLDNWLGSLGDDDYVSEVLAYLLDKDYKIKAEWVAKAINDNELIERIKEKFTFTFDEIYDARVDCSISSTDEDAWNEFYVQVHKHFPDPDFKDPFADPYEHFKCVQTNHVHDHLQSRYLYNKKKDELSIVVGYDENRRKISLGRCAEMANKIPEQLINEYKEATKVYDELNESVSKLFDEREVKLDEAATENERLDILDYFHDEIYGDTLPLRNDQASIVSKLYFVISMK